MSLDNLITDWFSTTSNMNNRLLILKITTVWFSTDPAIIERFRKYEDVLDYIILSEPLTNNIEKMVAKVVLYNRIPGMIYGWDHMYAYIYMDYAISYAKLLSSKMNELKLEYKIMLIICFLTSENLSDVKYGTDLLEFVYRSSQLDRFIYHMLLTVANNNITELNLFGRYPRRNKALKRNSTQPELIYLAGYGIH